MTGTVTLTIAKGESRRFTLPLRSNFEDPQTAVTHANLSPLSRWFALTATTMQTTLELNSLATAATELTAPVLIWRDFLKNTSLKTNPLASCRLYGNFLGTIAADNDNGIGVAGVAGGKEGNPGVSLMINTVFGLVNTDGFDESLVYGADNGAHISSNSWGYTVPDVYDSSTLDAIDYADDQGTVVVFVSLR